MRKRSMKRLGIPAFGMLNGARLKPGALGVGTPPALRTTPSPPGATTGGFRRTRPPRRRPPPRPAAPAPPSAPAATAGDAPAARSGGPLGLGTAAATGLRGPRQGR